MRTIVLTLVLAVASCGGVVRGTVGVSTPDLVYVAPGVNVVANYDQSIFFADGFYWWYLDGLWYRSTYYTGGWAYVASPPPVIVRIGDPVRYRYYRPSGYVIRNRPLPSNRIQRPPQYDRRTMREPRDHRR